MITTGQQTFPANFGLYVVPQVVSFFYFAVAFAFVIINQYT